MELETAATTILATIGEGTDPPLAAKHATALAAARQRADPGRADAARSRGRNLQPWASAARARELVQATENGGTKTSRPRPPGVAP